MLRISLALFLVCASASALAQSNRSGPAEACPGTETQVRESVDGVSAAPPKSSAARSKYARPTAAPSGGGSEEVLPRARGPKWHSFLPGMFR